MWAKFADRGLNLLGELVDIVAPLPDDERDEAENQEDDGNHIARNEKEGNDHQNEIEEILEGVEVEPRGRHNVRIVHQSPGQKNQPPLQALLPPPIDSNSPLILTDIELESPSNPSRTMHHSLTPPPSILGEFKSSIFLEKTTIHSEQYQQTGDPILHEDQTDVVDMLSRELLGARAEVTKERELTVMLTEKVGQLETLLHQIMRERDEARDESIKIRDTNSLLLQDVIKERDSSLHSLSELRIELSESEKKKNEADHEIDSLRKSISSLKLEYQDLIENTRKEASFQKQELECELQSIREANAELKSKLEQSLISNSTNTSGETNSSTNEPNQSQPSSLAQISVDNSISEAVIAELRSECDRLRNALTESEAMIKENEELAWQAKAEASELLFALDIERAKVSELSSKSQSTDLQPDHAAANAELTKLREAYETLERRFVESEGNAEKYKSMIDELDSKISHEMKEKIEMEKQVTNLMEELNAARVMQGKAEENAVESTKLLFVEKIDSLQGTVNELKHQKEEAERRVDTQQQAREKLEKELLTLTGDLAALRESKAQESNGVIEGLQQQVVSLKQQLQKSEIEGKQLHQVIAQLRSVRRNNKEDLDEITLERDDLKTKLNALSQEVTTLRENLKSSTALISEAQTLKMEHAQATNQLKLQSQSLEEALTQMAVLEKECYDKEAALEALKADNLLIQQDLDIRTVELENLHSAIQQMQRDKDVTIRRLNQDFESRLEQMRSEEKTLLMTKEALWAEKEAEFKNIKTALEQTCTDQTLLRRKAEMDFNTEKRRMQKSLEGALTQLRNATSNEDVVDRQLIANLIVSYFKRRRSLDVLDLIGRMLQFTDEQKEAVGLKVPSVNYISNFIRTVVGVPTAPPPDVEGDNLAELWVNFLLMESEEKNKAAGGALRPSPINISSESMRESQSPNSPTALLDNNSSSAFVNDFSTESRDSESSSSFDCPPSPTFSRSNIHSPNGLHGQNMIPHPDHSQIRNPSSVMPVAVTSTATLSSEGGSDCLEDLGLEEVEEGEETKIKEVNLETPKKDR